MNKIENAIQGLERFIDDFKPFCGNRDDWQRVYDVLALLREHEPRMMTLDETIASCENPVWLEENTLQGSYGAWGVVKGVRQKYNAVNIGGVRFGYWPRAKYNISWRCWSARPTEEQRKAVPWDAEP